MHCITEVESWGSDWGFGFRGRCWIGRDDHNQAMQSRVVLKTDSIEHP